VVLVGPGPGLLSPTGRGGGERKGWDLAAARVRGGRGVRPALVFLSVSCPSRRGGLGMLAESPRWAVRPPLFSWRCCRCCSVVVPFSSLADRGGEGSREGFSRFSAGGGVPRRAAMARALLFAWRPLRRALPLCLPPPARGWCDEFDGGPLVFVVSCDAPRSASFVQLLRCWKSSFPSSTSSAGHCRQASKILRGFIYKPVKVSGNQTSIGRPSQRSATAFTVGLEASGVIPASSPDGGWLDLSLGVGYRGGPDCDCKSLNEVLSTDAKDSCVIFHFYGVPCNFLYCHRLLLM
jgi:hypothetical protein